MSKKNILFVSIAFPPKLDPECIQTARYFKYMSQPGTDYDFQVVTSATPTLFMPVDKSLSRYTATPVTKYVVRLFEPRLGHAIVNRIAPALLQLPDAKYSFHRQWKKVIRQIDRQPDMIYSRSFPLSSAIMALRMQKHYRVPWVMHLSDPWVDSPLHRYGKYAFKVNSAWEKACFEAASYITLTSDKTLDLYRQKYPEHAGKLVLMPNVYDEGEVSSSSAPALPSDKIRFVYTGGLANTRSAKPLLEAIEIVRKSKPEILQNCEFIFAGDTDSKNRKLFDHYNDPAVTHLGRLSLQQATELQSSAHVLIAIDSAIEDKRMALFFPSKLLDYWAAGRPILALTTPKSTSEEFISTYKLGAVGYLQDPSGIADHIRRYIRAWNKGTDELFKIPPLAKEFTARYNAQRLLGLFEKLV